MNVAILASAFYPAFGGVEELVRQLALANIAAGVPTFILTNRWPRTLPEYEEIDGIPVHRLPFRVPDGGFKAQVSYRLTQVAVLRRTVEILRQRRADVMHVQCVSSNGYYAMLARRATGLPLIVTAQGELTMDAGGLYQRSAFANAVLRHLMAEADHVTGCSAKTLADLERHVGRTCGHKSSVVFNGANLADFDRAEPYAHPRPYVLAIGRVVPQKGFDVLIDAWAQSGLTSHDLLIAGDGPERPALEQRAAALGLGDRVRFLGRADRPTALSLFKGCSWLALPSRSDEGLPLVSVEAMAAGKAVIASSVGGVPESVADGQTGLLVPPADAPALAAGLRRLGAEPELVARLGNAGRARAQRFDWAAIAEQYRQIYRDLLPSARKQHA